MTLVTQQVTQRLKEKADLKRQQKQEFELYKVNQQQELHYKNTSAFNDKHIVDSMSSISESDASLDESLTRISGTWLFNRNLKPARSLSLENTIVELNNKQESAWSEDYNKTIRALDLLKTHGSPRDYIVMENVAKTHNDNGQLGIRNKKLRDGLYEKYVTQLNDPIVSVPLIESGSEEVSWKQICEQLDKKRFRAPEDVGMFGKIRESLQIKNKQRLNQLKESK